MDVLDDVGSGDGVLHGLAEAEQVESFAVVVREDIVAVLELFGVVYQLVQVERNGGRAIDLALREAQFAVLLGDCLGGAVDFDAVFSGKGHCDGIVFAFKNREVEVHVLLLLLGELDGDGFGVIDFHRDGLGDFRNGSVGDPEDGRRVLDLGVETTVLGVFLEGTGPAEAEGIGLVHLIDRRIGNLEFPVDAILRDIRIGDIGAFLQFTLDVGLELGLAVFELDQFEFLEFAVNFDADLVSQLPGEGGGSGTFVRDGGPGLDQGDFNRLLPSFGDEFLFLLLGATGQRKQCGDRVECFLHLASFLKVPHQFHSQSSVSPSSAPPTGS